MQIQKLFLLVIIPLLLSGCATMFDGKTQQVTFNTDPEGVTVRVDNIIIGKTPLSSNLDRKSQQKLYFEKDGYETVQYDFTTKTNPWVWLGITWLWYGGFSTTTDSITGALNEYDPGQYYVKMKPIGTANMPKLSDPKSYILVNSNNIIKEIYGETNEYLKALFAMTDIKEENYGKAKESLKQVVLDSKDTITLAENMIKTLLEYK